MSTIKTWKDRLVRTYDLWDASDYQKAMQAEITDLRTALAERDAEIERLRIPMNRWVVQSIKQEAETALVIGDEIGMRDGLTQILKECDAALKESKS